MELVGAGLDNGIHDGAVAAAEFCAIGIGLDFELGDGVDCWLDHVSGAIQDVSQVRVVVDAVEQEVILQRASAVGAEAVSGFDARSGFGRGDAYAEQSELGVVASVQGKRIDAPAVDNLAEFRGFGFELRLFAGDRDEFRGHARLKLQIHPDAILNVHLHRSGNRFLKPLLLHSDLITTNPERARRHILRRCW